MKKRTIRFGMFVLSVCVQAGAVQFGVVNGDAGILPLGDETRGLAGGFSGTESGSIGLDVVSVPTLPANTALLHKTIYVILFGGQSNALGWGYHQYLYETTNALAYPQNDIGMYSGCGLAGLVNVLTNLQCGVGNPSVKPGSPQQYPDLTGTDAIDHFGPELSMGRTVRDRIHIPNAKVAVIKYAASGTSLYEDWVPDGTTNSATDGPEYQTFQTTVRGGLAALQSQYPDYGIEILGMGWSQGASDALEGHVASYFENLTNFVADIRATFGTNIVFVLSKFSPNQRIAEEFTLLREAQQAAADVDPKTVANEAIGANYPVATDYAEGSLHFKSEALLQIGEDFGKAIMTVSGLDSDEDGLPDEWENSYPPRSAGLGNTPGADYDGDGLTDLQEYEAGTSPVDPADDLALSLGSGLRMQWAAKKDVRYQMLSSSNLTSWSEFGAPVLVRDSNSTVEVDFASYLATNSTAFFRLQIR